MRFCHTADVSSPDANGKRYRVDIIPTGSKKHRQITCYEAKCFGTYNDLLHDTEVIAKFPCSESATLRDSKKWAVTQQDIAKEAEGHAAAFKNMTRGMSMETEIRVLQPHYANLDKTSFLDKKRKNGEFFLFETKLEHVKCFIGSDGEVQDKPARRRSSVAKVNPRVRTNSVEEAFQADLLNGEARVPTLTSLHISTPVESSDEPRLPTYEESQAVYGYGTNTQVYTPFSPYPLDNVPEYTSHPAPSCPVIDTQTSYTNAVLSTRRNSNYDSNYDSNNNNNNNNSDDDINRVPHARLQAFVHYVFCHTQGKRVIANLKGQREEGNRYILTMPTIHSADQSYGKRDRGMAGILEVIENHTCSKLCRHLPDMNELFGEVLRSQSA